MTRSVAPVLVAGGGPTGLLAALTLLRYDVPVRIIDREPQYHVGQRSSGVWPRTLELFHLLRMFEMHAKSWPIYPAREYKPGTVEPIKTYPVVIHVDPTPLVPYSNPMFLGQPVIEEVLRSHLEKYGCFVELATELKSFEDDGERILAKIAKKKDGEEVIETFEASYLFGADGAKGVTRKQLGLTFVGQTRQDINSVFGDICMEIEGIERGHWHMFGDRAGDLVIFRPTDEIAPDGFQFLMILKSFNAKLLVDDEQLLLKWMADITGQNIKVRKIVVCYLFRPNIRMVDSFRRGRAFVAGDAAHVHSPTGGQGLNTSVQDSFNLAWKLALVHKGLAPESLLDTYNSERLPVIAEMLEITTGVLGKLRSTGSTEGLMGRDKRLNMLGVNYRTSPIVIDEYTHAEPVSAYMEYEEGVLVAGDRSPDAPDLVNVRTRAVTRLFDVFNATYHTVLLFTPDASTTPDILEVLQDYPKDAIRSLVILPQGTEETAVGKADMVVDRSGHAYRGYLAVKGERKVVVVRPDGVAGAVVHGAEGLRKYLDKIFVKD